MQLKAYTTDYYNRKSSKHLQQQPPGSIVTETGYTKLLKDIQKTSYQILERRFLVIFN